jgi:hypothetical protein
MADDLDGLSTHELHDRAVRRAERHLDVKFFWSLLKLIPAAKAASGELGEALRPVFIDYLRKHADA